MSYSDLLRDPRWQRMRLEVMQRADFACEECGDRQTTLNVHHTYYGKGRKPWEYNAAELRCLCEPCHGKLSELLELTARIQGGMSIRNAERVLGFAYDLDVAASTPFGPAPTPPADPTVDRLREIDRALPLATAEQKEELVLEKMRLRDELRAAGKRPTWKALR